MGAVCLACLMWAEFILELLARDYLSVALAFQEGFYHLAQLSLSHFPSSTVIQIDEIPFPVYHLDDGRYGILYLDLEMVVAEGLLSVSQEDCQRCVCVPVVKIEAFLSFSLVLLVLEAQHASLV